MTTTLILPHRVAPSNLHLRDSVSVRYVESDVYDICKRMQAISPNLYVIELDEGDKCAYAIMERCTDGVDRLVYKVAALDGRVLDKLNYLMHVPLTERLRILDQEEHKFEEDRKDAELERLYEDLGRPMWHQLEHDGFTQRPISYPKSGHVGGRGSKARS